jgi:hypothetical protein
VVEGGAAFTLMLKFISKTHYSQRKSLLFFLGLREKKKNGKKKGKKLLSNRGVFAMDSLVHTGLTDVCFLSSR